MSAEPRDPHRLRFWGWLAVVLTIVIALVYLLIAAPWSTYDGKKPKSLQHNSSLVAVALRPGYGQLSAPQAAVTSAYGLLLARSRW